MRDMTLVPTQLASLIGSRICHDLISPIGAISNGIELLSMTQPNPQSEEMQLLQDSCQNANARIRFFRIAFGSAQGHQTVPLHEIHEILQALGLQARVTLSWATAEHPTRHVAQTGFLAAMCLEAALIRGGSVSILQDDGGLLIRGSGPVVQTDPMAWAHLTQTHEAEVTPAQVQFAMLRIVARDQDARIDLSKDETQINLSIRWAST